MLHRSIDSLDTSAAPTPRELAGSVRRTAAHQVAESRLATLRDKSEEIRRRVMALHAAGGEPNAQVAREIDAQDRANDRAIREVRDELISLRSAHAERVEKELRPLRRAAARRLAGILDEIDAAYAELNGVHEALRRYGCDAPGLRVPDTGPARQAVKGHV